MLTEYIRVAMHRAVYEILEDGQYYGEIPELEGLLASGSNLEDCRNELQSALEDWLVSALPVTCPFLKLRVFGLLFQRQRECYANFWPH